MRRDGFKHVVGCRPNQPKQPLNTTATGSQCRGGGGWALSRNRLSRPRPAGTALQGTMPGVQYAGGSGLTGRPAFNPGIWDSGGFGCLECRTDPTAPGR